MGVFYRNNAEGAASGTTITTSNSDDNNAGDALDLALNGTRVYDNAWVNSGSTSFKVTTAASEQAILGWNRGTQTGGVFRGYFRISANPASTVEVLQARTPTQNAVQVQITSTGKINIRTAADAALLYASTASVSLNTTYRFELRVVCGTTASNGVVSFGWYAGNSTTPVESVVTSTTANTRTATIEGFRFGQLTTGPAYSVWIDDVAYEDGGTAFLGPKVGDPVAVASQSQAVELNVSGYTSPVLSQVSGTTATVGSVSGGVIKVTRPASHSDFLRFTLTHAGGSLPVVVAPDNLSNVLVYRGVGGASVLASWKPPDPTFVPPRSFVLFVDTAGSNGTPSLTQLSGPTVTISAPVGGVFRVDLPLVAAGEMRLRLSVLGDGPTPATVDLLVPAHGMLTERSFAGGDASSESSWL